MPHFYAQLNNAGLCVAVTQTTAPLVGEQFVELDAYDLSYLGRQYVDGAWLGD